MKNRICVTALVVAVSLSATSGKAAPEQTNEALEALKGVPVVEIPAEAAKTVLNQEKGEREAAAIAIVQAVAQEHPKALMQTLSALASADANIASAVAAAIAEEDASQAKQVAVVASQAAPQKGNLIAARVAHFAPEKAPAVASGVGEVLPESQEEVLASVAFAVPESSPELERVSASFAQQAGNGQGGGFSSRPGGIGGDEGGIPARAPQAQRGNSAPDRQVENLDDPAEFSAGGFVENLPEGTRQLLQSKFENLPQNAAVRGSFLGRFNAVTRVGNINAVLALVESELRLAQRRDLPNAPDDETIDEILSQIEQTEAQDGLEQAKEQALDNKLNYASP